jgi:hypothetical protein
MFSDDYRTSSDDCRTLSVHFPAPFPEP